MEIKRIQVVVDYRNDELYNITKNYFACFTNFLLPIDKKNDEYSLTLKNTEIKAGGKEEKLSPTDVKTFISNLQLKVEVNDS